MGCGAHMFNRNGSSDDLAKRSFKQAGVRIADRD